MASAEIDIVKKYEKSIPRPINDVIGELELFSALLARWQRVQNLVSRETLQTVWTRHFADSLQILKLLKSEEIAFLDLGSGGGLPAVPLAIALKTTRAHFTLVEPNSRKVSFLRTVARELDLRIEVEGKRSDQIDSRETGFDVITSRALAPLNQLCEMAQPFFGPTTRAIFHKGREHVEELKESSAHWHYDVLLTRSDTDEAGVLVELSNLCLKTSR